MDGQAERRHMRRQGLGRRLGIGAASVAAEAGIGQRARAAEPGGQLGETIVSGACLRYLKDLAANVRRRG